MSDESKPLPVRHPDQPNVEGQPVIMRDQPDAPMPFQGDFPMETTVRDRAVERPANPDPSMRSVPSTHFAAGDSPRDELEQDAQASGERRRKHVRHPSGRRELTDDQIRLAYDMEMITEALASGHPLPPLHTLEGEDDEARIDNFIKVRKDEREAREKEAERVRVEIEAREKEQAKRDEEQRKADEAKAKRAAEQQEADARAQGKDRAGIKPVPDAPYYTPEPQAPIEAMEGPQTERNEEPMMVP